MSPTERPGKPRLSSMRNLQQASDQSSPIPSAMLTLSPEQKSELPNLIDEKESQKSSTQETPRSDDDENRSADIKGEMKSSSSNVTLSALEKIPAQQESKEPLIGYWSWKNSYTVHKIEMHLARNTDLALHIVMAILCNQVRSERNAVAMTV
jgi:hypothetical protein